MYLDNYDFVLHLNTGIRTLSITATPVTDYKESDFLAEFQPHQSTATARIPITDDSISEDIEEFKIWISHPSEGLVGPLSESVVSIVDNDGKMIMYSVVKQCALFNSSDG